MIVHGYLNEKPVQVVLDSTGTRFEDSSRLVRARRMWEHAREHGQYAVSDGFMVRCSRKRGLSLAAQLEKLLPEHSGLVFIALSAKQVYQAMLHDGLVYTEEIRTRAEAEQELLAVAGQAVVVETTERSGFAEEYSGTELELSAAKEWHFRPMWQALLLRGLPHPVQLVGLLIPVFLAILGISGYQYWASWSANNEAVAAQFRAVRDAAQQRQHPAAAQRQILVLTAFLQELKAYRAQGLESLEWDGETVTLRGALDQATIGRLQGVAGSRGEELRLRTEGWVIEQPLTAGIPEDSPRYEPVDLADWLGSTEAKMRLLEARIELHTGGAGSGYTEYKLKLITPRGEAPVFLLLAEILEDVPASVEKIAIAYERAWPMQAKLDMTVWGT